MELATIPPAHLTGDNPFIVRGHHTKHLFNIIGMGLGIEEIIDRVDTVGDEYRRDVFGDTDESEAVTRTRIRNYFEDYLELDDESMVRVVDGQKDGICNACAIGKHCDDSGPSSDKIYIKTIKRMARDKGLSDQVTEGESRQPGKRKPKKYIELPAGILNTIFNDIDFFSQTLPPIIRFGVTRRIDREIRRRDRKPQ